MKLFDKRRMNFIHLSSKKEYIKSLNKEDVADLIEIEIENEFSHQTMTKDDLLKKGFEFPSNPTKEECSLQYIFDEIWYKVKLDLNYERANDNTDVYTIKSVIITPVESKKKMNPQEIERHAPVESNIEAVIPESQKKDENVFSLNEEEKDMFAFWMLFLKKHHSLSLQNRARILLRTKEETNQLSPYAPYPRLFHDGNEQIKTYTSLVCFSKKEIEKIEFRHEFAALMYAMLENVSNERLQVHEKEIIKKLDKYETADITLKNLLKTLSFNSSISSIMKEPLETMERVCSVNIVKNLFDKDISNEIKEEEKSQTDSYTMRNSFYE